ncbi:hypothetical protein [Streptomonospora litoralis]|uniref:Uncharacterized protein n=1 Tax=Streptomonospora litoralis TaxID=2498135 RepID=A0A4P6Q925_9ACTN|nr:hypothetical protein [Streptomonospora litoralis]QBI55799.1 hypothetical protein EKD16_20180 [Streptomonospora litoralis]
MTDPDPDSIPADQRWFRPDEWQKGEREATWEIAAGEVTYCEDVDAMFHGLDR